jgi:hypothetical protein
MFLKDIVKGVSAGTQHRKTLQSAEQVLRCWTGAEVLGCWLVF